MSESSPESAATRLRGLAPAGCLPWIVAALILAAVIGGVAILVSGGNGGSDADGAEEDGDESPSEEPSAESAEEGSSDENAAGEEDGDVEEAPTPSAGDADSDNGGGGSEPAPSSSPPRTSPLMINPCDVVTAESISAMGSATVSFLAGDVIPGPQFDEESSRRAICQFGSESDIGYGVWAEIQRGEQPFFVEFQSQHADALTVNELDFGQYGEIRVLPDSKNVTGQTLHEGTYVAAQVHYQGENQVSGLFIRVETQPNGADAPYASTEEQDAVVRAVAELLWDELVTAQG